MFRNLTNGKKATRKRWKNKKLNPPNITEWKKLRRGTREEFAKLFLKIN